MVRLKLFLIPNSHYVSTTDTCECKSKYYITNILLLSIIVIISINNYLYHI